MCKHFRVYGVEYAAIIRIMILKLYSFIIKVFIFPAKMINIDLIS